MAAIPIHLALSLTVITNGILELGVWRFQEIVLNMTLNYA
jgi:hypothetical protein